MPRYRRALASWALTVATLCAAAAPALPALPATPAPPARIVRQIEIRSDAPVDYPPILDRPIVAGSHLVTFEWPDGVRAEQRIQVLSGKPSYVMGRKP